MPLNTTEKQFESDIAAALLSPAGGYTRNGDCYDPKLGLFVDTLIRFVQKTQPNEWAFFEKQNPVNPVRKFCTAFNNACDADGLLSVLRYGFKHRGRRFRVCYFQPESALNQKDAQRYAQNEITCNRQWFYSDTTHNSVDMVLAVNGIPVFAFELKNQFTGQTVENAKQQWMHDRDPREVCFQFNKRILGYFCVDLTEVWMATRLAGKDTRFLPFNQGSNGAGRDGGAGNPPNPNGYLTAYLWVEVFQKDSMMDILQKFMSLQDGKTLIFPRYHQLDVVRKLVADVRQKGAGQHYLIQHSAGSGKSNSIAWIAYRLASVHDAQNNSIFDSVIVVTNRVVLDSQLQDTINSFEHQVGLVEAIDDKKNSHTLAQAINDKKRIIICTIQKFLFAKKDMEAFRGRKFAIIIDEAHQGQNGESAKSLRRSLIDIDVATKEYAEEAGIAEEDVELTDDYINEIIGQGRHDNQSFFAFTATPKAATLELFGTEYPDGSHHPFHIYSMRQAIEEHYILDVLASYTTIKEAFKLIRVSEDNPELIEGKTSRALFKYYKKHGYTIAQKTDMIMANFVENCRYQINGKGKAMVVADSRANAVRYYLAIKRYIKAHPDECAGCNAMIAFSGEVTLEDYPSDKPFTEATMNLDEKGRYITTDKKFRQAFHSSQYNILVVANKYQTGFDEPLLHTMYVDKKLMDVTAVQTLSRLNRTYPGKNSTFVLDFENSGDDIRNAFLPYYETTILEGSTDLNKVYDLRNKVRNYMLYSYDDVGAFNKFMTAQRGKKQDPAALGKLTAMFRPVIARYQELSEEDRFTARDYVRKFNGAYSYITQLVRLHDKDLFNEYQYTMHLARLLPRPNDDDFVDIEDKVKLEYAKLNETFKGAIVLDEKPVVLTPSNNIDPKLPNKRKDTLQSIIDKVNERFSGNFTDSDRVIIEGIYQMFMKDSDVKKFKKYAKDNSTEMFVQSLFPDKFRDIVTQCFLDNNDSFAKLFNDPEFYQKVQDAMAAELYTALRKDKE